MIKSLQYPRIKIDHHRFSIDANDGIYICLTANQNAVLCPGFTILGISYYGTALYPSLIMGKTCNKNLENSLEPMDAP